MTNALRSSVKALGSARVAERVLHAVIIVTLIAVTVGERSWLAAQRQILQAGDTFNFINIARHLRVGSFPLGERRLPGYPLAIALGMELGLDPVAAGIAASIASAGGTIAVLYLLGRRLGAPLLPLALFLLLSTVSPFLSANDIRPLSDSFFLFLILLAVALVTIARPTRRFALGIGTLFALLALTRYEGIPLSVLLLLTLRLRVPWSRVVLAGVPLIAALLLWVPVARYAAGGSLANLAYFQEAKEEDRGAGPAQVATGYLWIVKSAGWGAAWDTIPALLSPASDARDRLRESVTSPTWWISILGSGGVLWMLFARRREAMPLLLSFAIYPLFPAWWFAYGRYVAPMSAVYFFSAAVGAAALWLGVRRATRRLPPLARAFALVLLATALASTVLTEAPGMMKQTITRAFDNNGAGYAFYRAVQSLRRSTAVVGYADSGHLAVTMTLGSADRPTDRLNPGRGVYANAKPEASVEELAAYFREQGVEIVIDNGEESIVPLVEVLRTRDMITETKTFRSRLLNGEIEETSLHTVDWSRGGRHDEGERGR